MKINNKNKKDYKDESSTEFLINKKDVDMRCIKKEDEKTPKKENKK